MQRGYFIATNENSSIMNEEQIRQILNSKIEILKKADSDKKDYTDVYVESVEFAERISIHSQIGKFPEKLFKTRAPNQTEAEFLYLKATYKTTSFTVWERFMGFINRIWNDQNWSISWSKEKSLSISESESPQYYLEKEYPIFHSIESYYKNVVLYVKEKDANALMVHKPSFIPAKQNGDEFIIDESELIKPVAYIYSSSQVLGFVEDEYALILLKDKSPVTWGNGKMPEGLIFEFYDDENIWKIIQVGKKIDYKFDFFIYWNHALGYVPVKKLGGNPIQKDKGLLYHSHFMSAIEPLDDVLLDSSYLRAIKAGHAFPHKWEYYEECDFNNGESSCVNGRVLVSGIDSACPSCSGTGKVRPSSPLGVFQVKMPTRSDDSSKDISTPPFGWVAPDPLIMEFLRKEIEINKLEALSILNLFSNSDVKGSDTALGKQIDREDSFSFVQSISNQNFELFEFSHKVILQMRYGKDVSLPVISYPKNFSIRNESELTEELSQAKEKGLPEIAIRKILLEYLITRFSTEAETMKAVNLTFYSDRLISLTSLEISQKKLSRSVLNWEDILHTSIYTFITESVNEDVGFFDKAIEDQKAVLILKAKAKDLEINPPALNIDTTLIT